MVKNNKNSSNVSSTYSRMYLLNISGLPSFDVGRHLYFEQNLSFWTHCRTIKRLMRKLWQDIGLVFKLNNGNLAYFPARLLKQQTENYSNCCKNSYFQCVLEDRKLNKISMIEAELMLLFVSLKKTKNNDSEHRVVLFVKQLVKLLAELAKLSTKYFTSFRAVG